MGRSLPCGAGNNGLVHRAGAGDKRELRGHGLTGVSDTPVCGKGNQALPRVKGGVQGGVYSRKR